MDSLYFRGGASINGTIYLYARKQSMKRRVALVFVGRKIAKLKDQATEMKHR